MASQYRTRGYRPGELIHLTCRGYRRERIFRDDADHLEFLNGFHELNASLDRQARLGFLANAQMPNHQHMFVRNGDRPDAVTDVMHSLCTRYGMSFNWRTGRKGKVFERPFRGKIIRGGEHIANTFAYIHLNPDSTLRMQNSSHAFYAGLKDDPHIDPSLAWQIFGGREGYLKFFADTARVREARARARARLLD